MLQTCIAKGNGIELLQASCTAITRYLLALSCKCCSGRRFPFQLVQVLGYGGARVLKKMGLLKSILFQTRFLNAFLPKMVPKSSNLGAHMASKNGP